MVVHDGLVKIADFGIARMRSAAAQREGPQALGSPRYMSPEQVLRKRADHRSDIFSLGVVLYEMLTGAPPFAGADLNAILFQIVNLVPPAPSTLNAATPPMLDFIVAKALAKTPDERYATRGSARRGSAAVPANVDSQSSVAGAATSRLPAMPKIDAHAATPLLAKSVSGGAASDGQPNDRWHALHSASRGFRFALCDGAARFPDRSRAELRELCDQQGG